MPIASYRELVLWQKSVALVTHVYRVTQGFPKEEIYGLSNQIRRAAVSIPANVAEGQGRLTTGEFKQFLGHARGSMFELESHILIAKNLKYVSEGETETIIEHIHELGRLVNGLLNALSRTQAA